MGGGHVSRPDFGMAQPDPAHPLTEFYCLLQRGLDQTGVFQLPALWAVFRAPARRLYQRKGWEVLAAEVFEGSVLMGRRLPAYA